jgi:hypothetical protein
VATVRKMMDKNMSKFLTDFTKELSPTSTLPTNTVKLYNTAVNYTSKLWPIFMSTTSRIGQMQLLRRQIANALNVRFLSCPPLSSPRCANLFHTRLIVC